MMKRMISLFLVAVCMITACSLTACSNQDTEEFEARSIKYGAMINIPGYLDLYYDKNTNVVYLQEYTYHGNYIFVPYFAANGYPFLYDSVNNLFTEIER